jgi:hypothetical protein
MQMARRVMVFVLVSIAVIAIIAMVSFGLSHAQTMMENASLMGAIGGHMSQHDHGSCGEDMSTHMNATGNMLDECGDVHDGMNTAGHMMGMH